MGCELVEKNPPIPTSIVLILEKEKGKKRKKIWARFTKEKAILGLDKKGEKELGLKRLSDKRMTRRKPKIGI